MSLVPDFEIGIWNAWLLALPFVLANIITPIINKEKFKKISPDSVPPTKLTKSIDNPVTMLLILALIYSIFLPLKIATIWFYIGLPICLIGIVLFGFAVVVFLAMPLEEPINKGLYRYSRNPQYIAMPLMFIGIGIASASWIFLLISALFSLNLIFIRAHQEECYCLDKYGDAYREYMNRTPRWIGTPK